MPSGKLPVAFALVASSGKGSKFWSTRFISRSPVGGRGFTVTVHELVPCLLLLSRTMTDAPAPDEYENGPHELGFDDPLPPGVVRPVVSDQEKLYAPLPPEAVALHVVLSPALIVDGFAEQVTVGEPCSRYLKSYVPSVLRSHVF